MILDLVGYVPKKAIFEGLLVEPSAGDGSFLIPIVERLVESCKLHDVALCECQQSIVAFELDEKSVEVSRAAVRSTLERLNVKTSDATHLAEGWVRCGDYLLESSGLVGKADWVVGNPPYIRLEDLDNGGALYRGAFATMVGRADIYVAFYEAALRHLKDGGRCSFICADRWMFNQYGAELRRFVTSRFAVDVVIQMHHADAFDSEVSAYPAVTVIRNGVQGPIVVSSMERSAECSGGARLADGLHRVSATGISSTLPGVKASRLDTWFSGIEPWPLMEPGKLAFLKRLERDFPTLEETGALVGIGVATGADKVFITKDPDLVEKDRLLPLAMASDIKGCRMEWSGHYLVDPWNGEGLVNLNDFPKLDAHLNKHRISLQGRHVGKKNPDNWYRTIDRVNHALTGKPKLYLPDIKGLIAPVLDAGGTYPHHNVYFVSPHSWDPEVLGGILLSSVAQFFVEAYGVRMRGGYLRFQAQYLRRIRVPRPVDISSDQADRLRRAFRAHDLSAANRVAMELYCMDSREGAIIGH